MGNKTAIQSLLDLIEEGSLDSLYQVKQHLKNISLNEEKQQIESAFNSGTKTRYFRTAEVLGIDTLPINVLNSTGYYNSTYGKATEN